MGRRWPEGSPAAAGSASPDVIVIGAVVFVVALLLTPWHMSRSLWLPRSLVRPFTKQLELMAAFSVVGVHLLVGTKKMVVLLGLATVAVALVVRLRREHGRALGLHCARLIVRVVMEERWPSTALVQRSARTSSSATKSSLSLMESFPHIFTSVVPLVKTEMIAVSKAYGILLCTRLKNQMNL